MGISTEISPWAMRPFSYPTKVKHLLAVAIFSNEISSPTPWCLLLTGNPRATTRLGNSECQQDLANGWWSAPGRIVIDVPFVGVDFTTLTNTEDIMISACGEL
jgi:hypothetical protein